MRFSALKTICRAYRPSISVKFVLSILGFDVEIKEDLRIGLKWIRSCGGKLDDSQNRFLTKDSVIQVSDSKEKNSLI